jgi:hypothetical protein
MKWKPFYTLDHVKKFVGDGLDADGLTHLDISLEDRVLVLIRMLYDIKGKDAVVSFAGNCALRAYYNGTAYDCYAAIAASETSYAASAFYCTKNAICAANCAADLTDATSVYPGVSYVTERQWQIDYLVAAINENHM